MSTPCQQHAFFLNSDGRARSATLFLPTDHALCGCVLFVPPFAEERKGALPVFVKTARALAERGIASLFFDFSGCGDSEGDFDSQPPAAFESDCTAAWAWLADAFPATPRAILGLRCGAMLAARRLSDAAACVQWAPVTGPDFLRQLLQRRMVNDMVAYGKAKEGRAELEARLQRGETVDLDGYPVSGAFYTWLNGLNIPAPVPCPTLTTSGGHDTKTAAACAAVSKDATTSALRYPPFWNTVGHVDLTALITETVSWLAQRLPPTPRTHPLPALPGCSASAECVSLGQADRTVRAILDIPDGTPRAGALFLHGWSGDRTGPHRLFTRYARQLAQQGYLCLRPDFIGRGLSDGESSDASIALMAENAKTALEALRDRLPPDAPITVIAICSGCKVAVTLASGHPGIDRLVLWSAESMGGLRSSATGLRKTLNTLATYAHKLSRPETWKKLISGKVQTGMVTKALVKHETRTPEEAAWEDDVLKRFRAFRHPVLFVFGGSDSDAPGSSHAYAHYCKRNNIPHTMHTIPHAGHSYYGEAWTRELLDTSSAFLEPLLK